MHTGALILIIILCTSLKKKNCKVRGYCLSLLLCHWLIGKMEYYAIPINKEPFSSFLNGHEDSSIGT